MADFPSHGVYTPPVEFSDAIRLWLRHQYKNTTQTEVAHRAKKSNSMLSQFLNRKRKYIRMESLDRLIADLGISGETLIGQADEVARNKEEVDYLRAFRSLSAEDKKRIRDMLRRFGRVSDEAEFHDQAWNGIERRRGERRQVG